MTPQIRRERPYDIAAIEALVRAAFPTDAEARLVGALRAAERLTVSLVAELDGRIVGHVAFSPVDISACPVKCGGAGQGLAPLAVAAEFQRRGIGAALVAAGLEECRAAGAAFVVVLGEPAYYGRFGFRPARKFDLVDEYGGGEAFQVLELRPGGVPTGGTVRYSPEFAMFG